MPQPQPLPLPQPQPLPQAQCPPPWTRDPAVLVRDAADFYPFSAAARRCTTTAANSLVRFGVYLAVALALLCRCPAYLALAPALALVSAATYLGASRPTAEGFAARGNAALNAGPAPGREDVIGCRGGQRGAMSALVAELRAGGPPPAALRADPGDVFAREGSQRQFTPPPAQDVDGYEAWLLAGRADADRAALLPPTCREGNGVCAMEERGGAAAPYLA